MLLAALCSERKELHGAREAAWSFVLAAKSRLVITRFPSPASPGLHDTRTFQDWVICATGCKRQFDVGIASTFSLRQLPCCACCRSVHLGETPWHLRGWIRRSLVCDLVLRSLVQLVAGDSKCSFTFHHTRGAILKSSTTGSTETTSLSVSISFDSRAWFSSLTTSENRMTAHRAI